MDPECKLKSPKSTVKKIIEAKEFQKEQVHFTPTSPRKKKRTVRAEDRDCALTIAIKLNEAVTICINGHNSESEGVWAQGGEKEVPCFYYIIKKG